ncbi:MAG: hypothetical protein VW270_26955 [Candidatus Poseidoniales archaeon]
MAQTLASTLFAPFQTFKMKELNDSANNSQSVHPTMKCAGTSADIVRKYSHVDDNEGDWDDILSPDDLDAYYERKQYERMMRRTSR